MATHNDFGKSAEEKATEYLKSKNYKILAQNYRYLKAEIDIIAENNDHIAIVEVKARSSEHFNTPEQAVDKKKMKLIISAANNFAENINSKKEIRFDIISVIKTAGQYTISHIENAFEASDIQ